MNDQKPVKLKVYPIYGPHGIEGSREYCGACYVQVPRNVTHCPKCGGLIKPDVVLYEEGLDQEVIEGAVKAIKAADTLIIGGTSLTVYPAAGLINYFRGENLVLLNKSSTPQDSMASLVIHEPIGQVLSQIQVRT